MSDTLGAPLSVVRGEAVIGYTPLLEEGGLAFEYQSCSMQHDGSMEGGLGFVEGSAEAPGSEEWEAEVGRFAFVPPPLPRQQGESGNGAALNQGAGGRDGGGVFVY